MTGGWEDILTSMSPRLVRRPRTIIVEGPLALRGGRLAAAQRGEVGLQILTLPQLAARLAGGFTRAAQLADLEPAVRAALEEGGYADIAPLQHLPGMARAVVRSLQRLWLADVAPGDHLSIKRLADLDLVERRVRAGLGPAVLVPPDLAAAAVKRVALAVDLVGPLTLDHIGWVAPVWRSLIEALKGEVPVSLGPDDPVIDPPSSITPSVAVCADPRAEVVEALRWARDLIASGRAVPREIALATAAPQDWDHHMLALSRSADLPVHFSHGVSILTTVDGQACAALADVLAHGLSQDRVHRLIMHGTGRSIGLQALPVAPLAGISDKAHLGTLPQWRRALARAEPGRVDGARPASTLIPALELLEQGWAVAAEAGRLLLPAAAGRAWQAALRSAPAEALVFSLAGLRVADGRDPGNSIVWCPASHLAGAPRPFTRLIGLTASAWPRSIMTDPLVPEHLLRLAPDLALTRPDSDRRSFFAITRAVTRELSLSYPRRNGRGGLQAPSPLVPTGPPRVELARLRVPNHAFSEADRLCARLDEAARQPRFDRAIQCWNARRARSATAHDGLLGTNHPAILRALAEPQSARSLRRLLRDPLGYVWRHALGWRATIPALPPLDLNPRTFADLVHVLLQRTVNALEPAPGFGRASADELDAALAAASDGVFLDWPLQRATPPALLWRYTLDEARKVALRALRLDPPFQPGTRSWTEVRFGDPASGRSFADLPWAPDSAVPVPGTELTLQGTIDRLELDAGDRRAQLTDYQTGVPPTRPGAAVMGRGAELQRILSAIALARHRPDTSVTARLVYLSEETPRPYPLRGDNLAMAIDTTIRHLNRAVALVRAGTCLPGPDDPWEEWNDLRLALPCSGEPYRLAKQQAFLQAFGEFAAVWRAR